MAIRLVASIPWVTCSEVEEEPKPLGPGFPVRREKRPMFANSSELEYIKHFLIDAKEKTHAWSLNRSHIVQTAQFIALYLREDDVINHEIFF